MAASMFDKTEVKTSGEPQNRAAGTRQTHETAAEGSRANAAAAQQVPLPQLLGSLLDILHGARSLPPAAAIAALQPFLNAMRNRAPGNASLADASAAAVGALVQRLEAEGVATDDLWEEAIEASLSFANSLAPTVKL